MKPALVILAAGLGNRYGGLKQLDRVGPCGGSLLEYSVYDALRAGFGKIIFVIRKDFETEFRQRISSKFASKVQVEHVFQEIGDLPEGFEVPIGRKKPWGTAHAVYAARDFIDDPFGVINADDFYGPSAYEKQVEFLINKTGGKVPSWCLIGYPLKNTLSEHGTVSRAVCKVDKERYLLELREYSKLKRDAKGQISSIENIKDETQIGPVGDADVYVSMSCFGFTCEIFSIIGSEFEKFLSLYKVNSDGQSEFFLPSIVQDAIRDEKAELKVLPTNEKWLGLTYREDLQDVRAKIAQMVKSGQYPKSLWASSD